MYIPFSIYVKYYLLNCTTKVYISNLQNLALVMYIFYADLYKLHSFIKFKLKDLQYILQ